MIIALLCTLLLFLIAGLIPLFSKKSKISKTDGKYGLNTIYDYHLGNRQVSGFFVGLSSATTSNSAFMFVAMIPLVFRFGGYWAMLLVGWAFGIAATWILTYRQIRIKSEAEDALSFVEFLSNGILGPSIYFRRFASIVMVLFLGIYASGQLIASQSTVSAAVGNSSSFILLFGIFIVLVYSSIGGLKSTIYSDIVQAIVVLIGAFMLFDALADINYDSNSYLSATQMTFQNLGNDLTAQPLLKVLIFTLGWFFGGFFEMGQPHVIVRVMALKDQKDVLLGAAVYLCWFLFLSFMVVSTGYLLGMAAESNTILSQIGEIKNNDKLFGTTISTVLSPIPAGICIAGFLAASISTADSQILAAAAAVSTDWSDKKNMPSKSQLRLTTLIVGLAAFGAYFSLQYIGLGVYSIITLSWGAIAAAFVPSVLIRLFNRAAEHRFQLMGAIIGILTVWVWKVYGLDSILFEGVPGVIIATLITFIKSKKDVK